MNLYARKIWFGAEVRVADDVQIRESGKSQRLADAAPAGRLEIDDEVRCIVRIAIELKPKEERAHQRRLIFAPPLKAVRPVIWRMKRRVRLKDDVRLAGDKPGRIFRVREHRCRSID